jgi:hypothetical protein
LLSAESKSIEVTLVANVAVRGGLGAAKTLREDGDQTTLVFADVGAAEAAMRSVLTGGGRVLSYSPVRETLEDFFMRRFKEQRTS